MAMFRDRFWITLLLSLPTLVWSGMVQHMVSFSAPVFPGSACIPALFGTAVYVYGGLVFVTGGLRDGRPFASTTIPAGARVLDLSKTDAK